MASRGLREVASQKWSSSCPYLTPTLTPHPHPPPASPRVLRGGGVRTGLEGRGRTLTVPSCPSGPAAACDAAASSSSCGRAGGRGVTLGVEGPAAPRPSLPLPAAPLSPRMGGRRSALPGPAALGLPLALSSPAGGSAPGPQVTPLSKFVFWLFRVFRAPQGPPANPGERGSAGRSAVRRSWAPPPVPAPPRQPPWREAGKLPSSRACPASWVPAPPVGLPALG